MNNIEYNLMIRKTSLESNFKYWGDSAETDKEAKFELTRCKQLYEKVLKDIKKYEDSQDA